MSAQRSPDPAETTPIPMDAVYAGGPEMTLLEHLKELRNRVMVAGLAVLLGVIVCLIFWQDIIGWLVAPARETYPDFKPSVFGPVEVIGVMFKVGMYGGLLLASPVIAYEFFAFVVPGLTPQERKMILPGLFGVVVFLLGGMAFAYWVILPASLGFLLGLADEEFNTVIGVKQYIDFTLRIIFWVGVSFELPMVLAVAARLGMVTWRQLIGFWRYAIVIVFIVAAIVTPTPDPLTQSLVAGPLLILYGVGIIFAAMFGKKRTVPEAAA